MSLFDDASLCVTPNGVKEGKLYSIKPTDGSGDLSVTRATSATRVDANGLVEIPITNLLLRSQEFDNAYWGKQSGASVTANTAIAPDGTTTADTINLVSGSTISRVEKGSIAFSANTYLTISVYLKNISLTSGQTFQLRFETSGFDLRGTIDLFNKTNTVSITGTTVTGYVSGTQSASITELSDGWLRCNITVQSGTIAIGTGTFYLITNVDANRSFYAWGAQLEVGNVATEYIPTVASIRTKFAGITQDGSSASNIPRLDYTNGSCPSILVERQRTNLKPRSNDWTNSTFTLTNVTQSQSLPQPLFGTTALQIRETTANSSHVIQIQPDAVLVIGQVYTRSFYVKPTPNRTVFNFSDAGQISNDCRVNLSTKTVISKGINVSNVFFKDQIDGIIRVEITFAATGVIGRPTINIFLNNTTNTYVGDVNEGIDLYHIQYELGANATSSIITLASTVTRNADVISKTGISSLIGQTDGTIFVDVNYEAEGISKYYLTLGNSVAFYISILARANNKIGMDVVNSTTQVNASSTATYSTNQRLKIAMTYKLNDFKLYVNGVLQATDTSGTVPTRGEVLLGSSATSDFQAMDGINSALIFKTALTDEQLIQLTTI
jgi:hypothetical protein